MSSADAGPEPPGAPRRRARGSLCLRAGLAVWHRPQRSVPGTESESDSSESFFSLSGNSGREGGTVPASGLQPSPPRLAAAWAGLLPLTRPGIPSQPHPPGLHPLLAHLPGGELIPSDRGPGGVRDSPCSAPKPLPGGPRGTLSTLNRISLLLVKTRRQGLRRGGANVGLQLWVQETGFILV